MPVRILRPGLTTSERFNACDWFTQSLYVRLLTLVDDFGRYDANPRLIKSHAFPLSDDVTLEMIAASFKQLATCGIVQFYEADGKSLLQFDKWQERVRSKSKYPDPPSPARHSEAIVSPIEQASAEARFNRGSTAFQPDTQPKANRQRAIDGQLTAIDSNCAQLTAIDSNCPPPTPYALRLTPTPTPAPEQREPANLAERPSEQEVLAYANQIGLAPWKATDWFNEMEACGWLDFNHRPVVKWRPLLVRVKTKWEADGRPNTPPVSKNAPQPTSERHGPSLKEVKDYARTKDDGSGTLVAAAERWWGYWEQRAWKRKDGKGFDWQIQLQGHLAPK